MNNVRLFITLIILCCVATLSLSETKDDLVERNGLIYKKFTDVPFTGSVTGQWQGQFTDGKKDGEWKIYFKDGQLKTKGKYKDGNQHGMFEEYYRNGQLFKKGNYINGKEEGRLEV